MTTAQIIAHRGASYLAPENTLVAFRKAMEIGADGVEMDVQKTYDNELVIHHDYMVDMHTDIYGQIGRAHVCTPVTSRSRMPSSA